MKKICLLLALAALGINANAQKARVAGNDKTLRGVAPAARPEKMLAETPVSEDKSVAPTKPGAVQAILGSDWATQVGYTYYDLQTYASISNQVQFYPSTGDVSVIWMYGRGIRRGSRTVGYNHYSASLNRWLWTAGVSNPGSENDSAVIGCHPGSRNNPTSTLWAGNLANGRLGWPNLIQSGDREAIAAYAVYPNDASGLTRIHTLAPTAGNYGAQFSPDRTNFDSLRQDLKREAVFHVAASAGNDSYVLTASDDSTSIPGLLNGGTVNNLVLHHTTNLGTTWASYTIPFVSSAYGIGGVKGTGYAIDAKGDQVSIVSQVMTARPDNGIATYLFKSSYKGQPGTWTAKLISKRTTADTSFRVGDNFALSTDGAFSVLIDNNGVTHVTSHAGYATLDSAGTSTGFFYMNGAFGSAVPCELYYWNDTKPDNADWTSITSMLDINGNGTIDIPAYSAADGAGPYPISGLSMSNLSVDSRNNLYITYSAVVENTQVTSNSNATRDIYVVASYDGGNNWTNPINVAGRLSIVNCFTSDDGSSGSGLYEDAFPVTQKRIGADNKLHLAFMSDDVAGMARGTTSAIAALTGWNIWRGNLISYAAIDLNAIEGAYLKATFPTQVCGGAAIQIPFSAPANSVCIYGPLTASTVFTAQLDTSSTGSFSTPANLITLGTFTGNAAGGVINATFPNNFSGVAKIRITASNGDPNANPPLYESQTGLYSWHSITVTTGPAQTPGAVTNLTSSGGSIAAGGTICSNLSATFNVPSVSNANQYSWTVVPNAAGSIQPNGDVSRGGNFALATFNGSYSGPVTVEARAINGCGTSQPSTFAFTLGGSRVTFDAATTTMTTSGTGGQWEYATANTGPFSPLTPAVTASTLNVSNQTVTPAGYYRYTISGCASNIEYWAGIVGLNNAVLAKATNVYPNPARESFVVAVNSLETDAQVSVFNAMGQVVKTSSIETTGALGGSTTLSTASMGKGIYFVRVSAGGATTTKRLVVE